MEAFPGMNVATCCGAEVHVLRQLLIMKIAGMSCIPELLWLGPVQKMLLPQAEGLFYDIPTGLALLALLAVNLWLPVEQLGLHRGLCILQRSSDFNTRFERQHYSSETPALPFMVCAA